MLTLIFLPITILQRLNGGDGVWTQSFTNIRMLDDALLPCLFLLWLKPGFLKYQDKNKTYNIIINFIVLLVSTIYLLNFFFHGSRACLLAIFVVLIIISFKQIKLALFPIATLLTAFLLYKTYHLFFTQSIGSPLNRTGSSGRIELWQKALQTWLEHPLLGTGGNHFFLYEPYFLVMHPHNIALKLLSEWGIAFFILIIFVLFIFKTVKSSLKNIPLILFAGCIGLFINGLLSGSFVYPVSQMTCLFFFAYTLQYLFKTSNLKPLSKKRVHYFMLFIIVFASSMIIFIHGQDIICYQCISSDFEGAPAFWGSGRPLHLEPYISENLGQHTTQH